MDEKRIKNYKYMAFMGLIGLSGFSYFKNHDLLNLFQFSYLAFFAYYPMYKALKKGVDERTTENITKANQIVAKVAILSLVLLGLIPSILYQGSGMEQPPAIYVGGAAIGFFCAITAQVAAFFYYERK